MAPCQELVACWIQLESSPILANSARSLPDRTRLQQLFLLATKSDHSAECYLLTRWPLLGLEERTRALAHQRQTCTNKRTESELSACRPPRLTPAGSNGPECGVARALFADSRLPGRHQPLRVITLSCITTHVQAELALSFRRPSALMPAPSPRVPISCAHLAPVRHDSGPTSRRNKNR